MSSSLQAVWGEEGRAVLTALDSLPEDVLLDADTTPPMSPTYGSLELAREEPADTEQQKQGQQQQAKQHSKGATSLHDLLKLQSCLCIV